MVGQVNNPRRQNNNSSPARDLLPSGVILWLFKVKPLCWCSTDPMVSGYVSSLLACLRERSVSMEGNPRVYQNTSQLANEMADSASCLPRCRSPKFSVECGEIARVTYLVARTLSAAGHFLDRGHLHLLPAIDCSTSCVPRPPSNAPPNNVLAIHNQDIRT